MFNYHSYSIQADETRSYIKYDCATKQSSTYTLQKALPISTYAGSVDDKYIDASDNAQSVVYLDIIGSDGKSYRGSGFIVGKNVIATDAHCLHNGTSFIKSCTVRIFDSAGTSQVASFTAVEFHIPQGFVAASPSDYGLIYVEDDLSAYGSMPLGVPTTNFKKTAQDVYVSGFPATVNEVPNYQPYRYCALGRVTTGDAVNQLYVTAHVNGGDSGGPIYIEYTLKEDSYRSAVGIVNFTNGTEHGGVPITLPLLRFYNSNPNIG